MKTHSLRTGVRQPGRRIDVSWIPIPTRYLKNRKSWKFSYYVKMFVFPLWGTTFGLFRTSRSKMHNA